MPVSERGTEASTEPVVDCPDCSRTWTVADVAAIQAAKTNGNRWLGVAIVVLVVGVMVTPLSPLVGTLVLALGVGVGVWSVKVNRRPLRAMTMVPLDERRKQELKHLDRTTMKLGGKMLWNSSATRAGVLYHSLTRGLVIRIFFLLMVPFTVAWFAVAGFFQRRFQRQIQCPGCLQLRVTINFLPKDQEEALQQLRAM